MQILAFLLYFAVVLAIGVYFFVKTKGGGEKEYFLGGRSMGPWVSAMSAQASDMSGWLLMGFPGSILAFGMGKVWIGIGLGLGTILNWMVVAKRLRRLSQASGDAITLPQYLTNRFASSNSALKIACAVIFLIAFIVYVASGFVAGTNVFVSICPAFQGRELLAMTIFAALILCYTFLGGYKAVCWTDFFQGAMMLCALLVVPIAIAILGRTYLLDGGEALARQLLPGSAQQMVFVTIVTNIFPTFVAGILLAAIIAASMSTADSQLLVASSAFSSDFYQPVVRRNAATDAEMLWVGRIVVVVVALVAFYIAASGLGKPGSWASSIMDMVENAWGLFGAASALW